MRQPSDTEVWVGASSAHGVGVRKALYVDAYGRDVIFWSRGEHPCAICGGQGSHEQWRAHLRLRSQTGENGRIRSVLWCPVWRSTPPLWAEPAWRTALQN